MNSPAKFKTPDGRNLIDWYWYWKQEAIIKDLETKRHPFGILVSNIFRDMNLSSVIRNSNAFLAKELYYYGSKRYDRRGTVGMHHYEKIKHLATSEDLENLMKLNYTWVAVDDNPNAQPIEEFEWPENPLMCFGEECGGIAPEIVEKCKFTVYIKQYGCVRNLNTAVASGIVMYDFVRKMKEKALHIP